MWARNVGYAQLQLLCQATVDWSLRMSYTVRRVNAKTSADQKLGEWPGAVVDGEILWDWGNCDSIDNSRNPYRLVWEFRSTEAKSRKPTVHWLTFVSVVWNIGQSTLGSSLFAPLWRLAFRLCVQLRDPGGRFSWEAWSRRTKWSVFVLLQGRWLTNNIEVSKTCWINLDKRTESCWLMSFGDYTGVREMWWGLV